LHRASGVVEEIFEQRVADLLRRQARPLCAPCVGTLLGVPHLTARGALQSLAMADEFAALQRCARCGGMDTVVGSRAA